MDRFPFGGSFHFLPRRRTRTKTGEVVLAAIALGIMLGLVLVAFAPSSFSAHHALRDLLNEEDGR